MFLTKEGLIKLGDFGISKVLSATRVEANTVVGTAHYISPEIVSISLSTVVRNSGDRYAFMCPIKRLTINLT